MYAFNSSAPLPVLRTGPLTTFFPSGSSIPQPLTAALSSYTPARVYFFGGSPRFVFSYSFNALSTTFSPLGSSTTLASAWPTDIQAATSFTFVNNGTVTLFAFNESSVARLDQNLNVSFPRRAPRFRDSNCSFPLDCRWSQRHCGMQHFHAIHIKSTVLPKCYNRHQHIATNNEHRHSYSHTNFW